ncbi:hypothetical protein FO519_007702 [Halicephalobus sp. NKZ332]|nr:hypothetical protein FO519_007702 [Halicephalobus sp. NKZ332]
MGQKPSIEIRNNLPKDIKIKIDHSRNFTKLTRVDNDKGSKLPEADSTNYTVRDQVHCKPQQGQGYTRIDEWRSTYFFLNIPKNTIYISIDYELEYEPLSGKLEKHCVHHPIQYWTKDTKLFPRIVINEFNNGIMFSVERSTYEVFCTVPTENSFTKMDPEQLAIFNPDNSRGDYAFLTVWIENDDKSWSVYCQNHPIPKSSQILVGQEGSEIPTLSICSTSKSKPSKSSESALIKFSNNSEKKIWVKINNDNQETSFEDNIGFISDYATENLVYYRAHQGNDYTEIDKGESTSFFLDISKHRISINYKTLSGELKQYPITDLIQYWNKDTGYLSEIEIRNSGEAIRHSIRRQKK